MLGTAAAGTRFPAEAENGQERSLKSGLSVEIFSGNPHGLWILPVVIGKKSAYTKGWYHNRRKPEGSSGIRMGE